MQIQEDKPYDDINITPMLDLAYVLLVIFILMCTASVQGMKVNLPHASNAPAPPLAKPKTMAITINNEGKIFYNTTPDHHAGADPETDRRQGRHAGSPGRDPRRQPDAVSGHHGCARGRREISASPRSAWPPRPANSVAARSAPSRFYPLRFRMFIPFSHRSRTALRAGAAVALFSLPALAAAPASSPAPLPAGPNSRATPSPRATPPSSPPPCPPAPAPPRQAPPRRRLHQLRRQSPQSPRPARHPHPAGCRMT